jgi:hypothetical protein
MRVVSLNLRAYPQHRRIADLALLIASHEPDLVLLQECRRGWLDTVASITGLNCVHSHDVVPLLDELPPDGCVIGVRAPLDLRDAWRLAPSDFAPKVVKGYIDESTPVRYESMPSRLACRFSARTLFAEVVGDAGPFVACSFHATPGSGRVNGQVVREWKPFFHGAVAVALSQVDLPVVFAVDANEPRSETIDTVTFHWANGRPGYLKFAALLGLTPLHRGRDVLREYLLESGAQPEAAEYLALTYTTRGGQRRRFDHVWATPEFSVGPTQVFYDEALSAGTDHALTVTELELAERIGEPAPAPKTELVAVPNDRRQEVRTATVVQRRSTGRGPVETLRGSPWTAEDADLACDVWNRLSNWGRILVGLLVDSPGEKVASGDIAAVLGYTTPSQVAGVLAWPGVYCKREGKALFFFWDTDAEGAAWYWMTPEVAAIFRAARDTTVKA